MHNEEQRTENREQIKFKEIPSHALRARNDGDSLWSFVAAKRIVILHLSGAAALFLSTVNRHSEAA